MSGPSSYRPPIWLRNGHIHSIIPSLFRNITGVKYTRERIDTPDDDFLDLDWSSSGQKTVAIISHGLEGNSHRAYVKGMVKALSGVGIDCCAWNYRSCSGEPNRQLRLYHNGATDDLDLVVRHAIAKGYESIFLVGFSMGGNLSLLYLGQQPDQIPEQVKGAVTFSVPLDLADSARQLESIWCRIYMQRFLRMLHQKVRWKMEQFPGMIDDDGYENIRTFKDFDDRYTAPLHGFKDAEDYWTHCSSGRVLQDIRVPCLIINARDDMFLGPGCYPVMNGLNNLVVLEYPRHGGHTGFVNRGINGIYWSETCAVGFILGPVK